MRGLVDGGPAPSGQRYVDEPLPWYRRWWVPAAGGTVTLQSLEALKRSGGSMT